MKNLIKLITQLKMIFKQYFYKEVYKANYFNFKNLSLQEIETLINVEKVLIEKESKELQYDNELTLIKPNSLTKKKLKYTLVNGERKKELILKQRKHTIKLLERLKRWKYKI